jgi:hypothetical protein
MTEHVPPSKPGEQDRLIAGATGVAPRLVVSAVAVSRPFAVASVQGMSTFQVEQARLKAQRQPPVAGSQRSPQGLAES